MDLCMFIYLSMLIYNNNHFCNCVLEITKFFYYTDGVLGVKSKINSLQLCVNMHDFGLVHKVFSTYHTIVNYHLNIYMHRYMVRVEA